MAGKCVMGALILCWIGFVIFLLVDASTIDVVDERPVIVIGHERNCLVVDVNDRPKLVRTDGQTVKETKVGDTIQLKQRQTRYLKLDSPLTYTKGE